MRKQGVQWPPTCGPFRGRKHPAMTGLRQRQHLVQRAARLGIDSAAEAWDGEGRPGAEVPPPPADPVIRTRFTRNGSPSWRNPTHPQQI
jgi:hypothetical protein